MTVRLGIDTSNVNGRIPDFSGAKAQGLSFSYHKVTEGAHFVDSLWPANRTAAFSTGMNWVCGYHFLSSYPDGATQADFFMQHLNDPDHKIGIVLDVEVDGHGNFPSYGVVAAFVDRIASRYQRPVAIYTYRSFWVDRLGNPNGAALGPLVDALYLSSNPRGSLDILAQQVTPDFFRSYGGWDLGHRLWRQFGSNGSVGGIAPCDVNFCDRDDVSKTLGIGVAPCPPAPIKLSLQIAQLPLLGPGSVGPSVKLLQRGLNVGQGAGLVEDGGYGPATTRAVINCERLWKQKPDGIEGPVVRRYLAYEVSLKGQ
jgi:hypothetical protein